MSKKFKRTGIVSLVCASVFAIGLLTADHEARASDEVSISSAAPETMGAVRLSDRRTKRDIQPIEDVLEKIRNLRGVSYKYRDDPSNTAHLGLIAQEVGAQFPEVIEEYDDYIELDYVGLIGPLVEAIKQLIAQAEANKSYISKLEARLTRAEAELSMLRQQRE